MAEIKIEAVRKEFGKVVAVKDVNLTIPDREFIVLLGPNTIRQFFPDIKAVGEHIGSKSYSAALDATVIIGFNPTQLYHDSEKRAVLTDVFREAKNLVEYT